MKNYLVDRLHFVYCSISRPYKRRLLIFTDAILFALAISGSFVLRFNSVSVGIKRLEQYDWLILLLIVIKLVIFNFKGIYRPILRYTGIEFLSTAAQAVLYSSGLLVFLVYLQGNPSLPRSILIIDAFLTLVLIIGARLIIRALFRQLISGINNQPPERLLIYGAGVAGSQLARALFQEPTYRLVGFVDDNPELKHQVILGFRVYPPTELFKLWERSPFDTVILAIPALESSRKREIIRELEALPVAVKTIPPLRKLLSGEVSISEIQDIDVAELLGREEVMPYPELLRINVTGKSVMVTGAGGSIGSELCRQIAQLNPKCLVMLELSEFSLYNIDLELAETYPDLKRVAYLGSVTDWDYVQSIIHSNSVNTIYHTAAYKHVPLVEANAAQGVYNNVFGTLTTAQCAIAGSVENFVFISTDKAVRPTNVMGASKRIAELIIQALAEQPETSTCFAMVRFGNVLDSSGSVVPRFRKQIAQGKPITVTHPEMTRYFMSIPEAVRLVMQAGSLANGGEVFLLDMGEPIRIYDLALQMIRLSGLEPEQDIEIKFTGLRPGEKLYEELLIDGDNINPTKHPRIFSANESKISWEQLKPRLGTLLEKARLNDYEGLILELKRLVPEYQPLQGGNRYKVPAITSGKI
jgi:FlaA1/EpsC-like NDP-sugar epimerase